MMKKAQKIVITQLDSEILRLLLCFNARKILNLEFLKLKILENFNQKKLPNQLEINIFLFERNLQFYLF